MAVGQRRLATMSAAILRLPAPRNGPSAHAVMLPSRSNETKFRFMTVVLYFWMTFLVGGQSLTPPAGPRPRDHKPGEGRTLSSQDFERPCRPVAACAPLANSFHTRNYRLERRASRGRGLSESGANEGLAWHSPLRRRHAIQRAEHHPRPLERIHVLAHPRDQPILQFENKAVVDVVVVAVG